MLKVGLTGGIGSGKSTVTALFEKKGICILDTDSYARVLTQLGSLQYKKIVDFFGSSVLCSDHSLDRVALRNLIFQDHVARQWLENLLHPYIIDWLIKEMAQNAIKKNKPPYIIAVVPLLIEKKLQKLFDCIVVVDTTEDLQRVRSRNRDSAHSEIIEAIIGSQCTRETRLSYADYVITNDGTFECLQQQVDALHERLNLFAR